ncbi:alpha/beta hydrolase [Alphaproteobacteria bacterium]|nr:alpha/beta hydrolase [Alphaproteobacteria bacterium]
MSKDSNSITRHFVTIENKRQIHYRRAGSGPPVLLLHQSPKSSKELIPVMEGLKDIFTCIAPDTPGNGNSDPIGLNNPSMIDYGKNINLFLNALGIDKVCLYGFHTGASVGGSFASQFPERVNVAILNGFVALNNEERDDIMKNYLTPFKPSWDGGHLLWSWARLREQHIFFPWYRISDHTRTMSDLPNPIQIHDNLMEFFRAGDEYRKPYGAAFMFKGDDIAKQFKSPTIICASDWDPTVRFLSRLPENLPSNVKIEKLGDKKGKEVTSWLKEIIKNYATGDTPSIPSVKIIKNGIWQDFINVDGLQLHLRRSGESGSTRIIQHDLGDDNNFLKLMYNSTENNSQCIAFDLPGHGESDSIVGEYKNLDSIIELISNAINKLGIDEFDLIGIEKSSAIALGILNNLSDSAKSLVLINPPSEYQVKQDELDKNSSFYFPPQKYGEHLITCWNFIRDQALFYPWYENRKENLILNQNSLGVEYLHQRLFALLKAGESWHDTNLLVNKYDKSKPLSILQSRITFAGNKVHPGYNSCKELNKSFPSSRLAELPNERNNWLSSIFT